MLSKEEFKNIFKAHFKAIRLYVYYLCGDMEIAQDVAQDVFMKIWEKRSSLKNNAIKPLLYKMATGCYVSSYRRKICQTDYEKSLTINNEFEYSSEDEMVYDELVAVYAKALEEMPEKQRTIFLMNREDGMKYAKIAHALGISIKSVEKHISAALRILRTKFFYK